MATALGVMSAGVAGLLDADEFVHVCVLLLCTSGLCSVQSPCSHHDGDNKCLMKTKYNLPYMYRVPCIGGLLYACPAAAVGVAPAIQTCMSGCMHVTHTDPLFTWQPIMA